MPLHERSHPIPTIPIAYNGGLLTHRGGNMDGRWRSDGDDDGDDLLQFPVPAGCQNGVSGAVSWNLVVAAERNSFWKNVEPLEVFRSEGFL